MYAAPSTMANRKQFPLVFVIYTPLGPLKKFEQIPRNSSPTRHRNRCWVTGRSRGFYKDFGLSRHVLREMGNEGLIPGFKKSSW